MLEVLTLLLHHWTPKTLNLGLYVDVFQDPQCLEGFLLLVYFTQLFTSAASTVSEFALC